MKVMNVIMQLQSAAETRGSTQREENEDAVYQLSERHPSGSDVGMYVVSDGMGGFQAGDQASNLAVRAATESVLRPLLGDFPSQRVGHWRQQTREAVLAANEAIYLDAQETERKMGSTMVLAILVHGRAYIANVGDSRAYIWRLGHLYRVTDDHSVAAELARANLISEEEIVGHPRSNFLSRALGQTATLAVDLFEWPVEDGDKLLLCSDGLWKSFPDAVELESFLSRSLAPAEVCAQLVSEALRRDGSDDASAVMVHVRVQEAPAVREEAATQSETMQLTPALA
jgi:protein phosphatase